jgi:hypothetical protein
LWLMGGPKCLESEIVVTEAIFYAHRYPNDLDWELSELVESCVLLLLFAGSPMAQEWCS